MSKQAVSDTVVDRTLGYEGPHAAAVLARHHDPAIAATLGLDSPRVPAANSLGHDATLAHDATMAHTTAGARPTGRVVTTTIGNSVLPCVDAESEALGELRMVRQERPRYEMVRLLGEGGMGEVNLMRDHDIARQVAFKRLRPEAQDPVSVARFVDEIRTIGRLEHPNIVPIHDVGIDGEQRYFFVMKYVEGETLESIIDKLAAGDAEYVRRYSYEARIELFLGVLYALKFAHSQGVIHRDIKPANVMVGRFGEVVLMDWGIAKQVGTTERPASPATLARDAAADSDTTATTAGTSMRLASTRHGALLGTPAYMSPEQAAGRNDALDVRSDLYSASVMFHELMGLQHYLAGKQTITEVLSSLVTERWSFLKLYTAHHPDAPAPPSEIAHFSERGLAYEPSDRFQSADEMIEGLKDILAGKVKVQCHATMTKRMVREAGRFVDGSPNVGFTALVVMVLLVLASVVVLARAVIA